VFQVFKTRIIERAAADFRLSLLLRDFLIHCVIADRRLPFYAEAAEKLLGAVQANDVSVVSTPTGSGKSTLMPLLLLASGLGYKRIAVTQPRRYDSRKLRLGRTDRGIVPGRFAAQSIQQTISVLHGDPISGFRMAGKSHNPLAPIVFITDGLLRTMLSAPSTLPFDVVIIDEVHERSMEIDTCVALLAKSFQSELMPKVKVILSSATFDEQVIRPFKLAKSSITRLGAPVEQKYKRAEHYADKSCSASCPFCHLLKISTHPMDMIVAIVRQLHLAPDGDVTPQLLCFVPSAKEVNDMVRRLGEQNIIAHPLYSNQRGGDQVAALRSGTIFISTNIAETSLTFPRLKFVLDLGKVQRPRMKDLIDGSTLSGTVMETVLAPKSTLKQRLGRVGRTMHGHYIGLYDRTCVRDDHIKPKFELELHDDMLFSLYCQMKPKQKLSLDFPTGTYELETQPADFFRYPVLGGLKMAQAFHAAQRKHKCGEQIFMIAALRMKLPSKMLQELAFSASKAFAAKGGDISALLGVMARLNAVVGSNLSSAVFPFGSADYSRFVRTVITWCNQHALSQ
jgi:ATP-dependent helicase HrpB